MKIYVIDFNKKSDLLKGKILGKKSFDELEQKIAPSLCTEKKFTVIFSVCDTFTRAKVVRFTASTLADAWYGANRAASRYVSSKECNPAWVKADIVCKSERISTSKVIEAIAKGYNGFYRKGISFDDEMKTALLEAEINSNHVISYKEHTLKIGQVNKYISKACGVKLDRLPDEVIVFDCISVFCDENSNTFSLYGSGNNCGRRKLKKFDRQAALDIITSSSEYLSMHLDFSGKFEYGVYPAFHNVISGYNILRHASSIWSLICAHRITGDKYIMKQAEAAIGYLIKHSFYKYKKPRDEENTAYIADIEAREVKLGGNAVAIIVLTEYMNETGSDRYKKLCTELGNGILELLNPETGEFYHVLSIPSLKLKEKKRTIFYDGEAAFALSRLYALTGEQRWLDAASAAVERFIREDYTKYRDHWVAYAMNEITKFKPEERFFNFALRNAQENLKKIYTQKTTYHTYLELLCVTFELYSRMTENNINAAYLSEFDVEYFVKTIFYRAGYMLNGYCYPEYVMYFKYPDRLLGGFFIRHDSYRMRIDDIQHFCGAYYLFYKNYEKLDDIRRKAKKEK